MTDRAQFEAMLEAIVNDDHDAAKEIFHNIVVAKSREIYEELLSEDFNLSEAEEEEEESDEADDSANPFASSEEDEEDEEGEEDEEAGDASDDFSMDSEDDDSEEGEEGGLEDRVLDLEDALEELKAEFDSLMADEAGEEEHNDGVNDPDFGDEDEFGGDEFDGEMDGEDEFGSDEFGDEEPVKESPKKIIHYHVEGNPEESLGDDEFMEFMEYVNKVALPKHGDNGANTKSIVASKNDMGGTTANILKGGTESPTFANQGHLKGNGVFKGNPTEENFGNINVPGGKAGKTGFTHKEPGHGAEKKGKGDTAPNKQSIIGSRK